MPNPIAILAVLPSIALGHTDRISAAQILAKCQKAYDSVTTFQQDARATTRGTPTTAQFWFSRPGKLHVIGVSLPGSKYELIVNGGSAEVFNAGQWQKVDSPDIGLANLMGVSGSAATNVSALLLHTKWGGLSPASVAKYKVSEEKVRGYDCYKLEGNEQLKTTVWIDKKTFFLVRTNATVMKFVIDVEYGKAKINKPIPNSRFAK